MLRKSIPEIISAIRPFLPAWRLQPFDFATDFVMGLQPFPSSFDRARTGVGGSRVIERGFRNRTAGGSSPIIRLHFCWRMTDIRLPTAVYLSRFSNSSATRGADRGFCPVINSRSVTTFGVNGVWLLTWRAPACSSAVCG